MSGFLGRDARLPSARPALAGRALGVLFALALGSSLFLVTRVQSATQAERGYFIAADDFEWGYAPSESDLIKGEKASHFPKKQASL
jgi:hypothetical protein